ncbi:MAG: aminotransferase class I/II-fold pyridoxal phosphate-dependent enzyme [Acidobacteriota bacterium]|nr:aminotransferase class I/II-fold pyridoxal phosphate-dependent enzyme [Acidobacteriota bacterium]
MTAATSTIQVASRVHGFSYAIRNIVAEAKKVEAVGTRVRYLNIGDPIPFGFKTPQHLLDAVQRAMHDGLNGYTSSPGIEPAREAVAEDFAGRGLKIPADRVLLTMGTSEGIELALTALVDPGEEVLVPVPTYPLYTAVLAKLGANAAYYQTDPNNNWMPDLDHIESLIGPRTRALVVINPNNPTGAVYSDSTRRKLLELANRHSLLLLADEVYADLAYDGPISPIGSLDPEAPVISFSSLSKAYLAPGWRAGWMAVGTSDRLNDLLAAIKKLADGRLCSTAPMQAAITAALTQKSSDQNTFRAALRERAELTTARLNAIDGMSCVAPTAAFYAVPQDTLPPNKTDEDYVLGLLRSTGVLCVHGSGFGLPPGDGFMRVVFLANPQELNEIYDLIDSFTSEFLST